MNGVLIRPRFCTVRLYWAGDAVLFEVQGAVLLKFRSSFLSTKYTIVGAKLLPKSCGETVPRFV